MPVELVAPREIHPLEADAHLYRVVFWRQQTPRPSEEAAWRAELCDLSAEDVHEVIAWADCGLYPPASAWSSTEPSAFSITSRVDSGSIAVRRPV